MQVLHVHAFAFGECNEAFVENLGVSHEPPLILTNRELQLCAIAPF